MSTSITTNRVSQPRLKFSCSAGDAAVNIATGKYNFEHPDISIGANSYFVSLSHVYCGNNSVLSKRNINTHSGEGWKLNAQQYVGPSNNQEYYYIDAAGNEHKFLSLESFTDFSTYYDTSGLNLTLKVIASDAEKYKYDISDDKANHMLFDANGNMIKLVNSVSDTATVAKIYEYAGDKLIAIYDENKKSRKLEFEYYDNGLLRCVNHTEGAKTMRSVYFLYYDGKLIAAVEKIGDKARYDALFYYSNNNLNLVVDGEDLSAVQIDSNGTGVYKVITGSATLENYNRSFSAKIPFEAGEALCGDLSCGDYCTTTDVTAIVSDDFDQSFPLAKKTGWQKKQCFSTG